MPRKVLWYALDFLDAVDDAIPIALLFSHS